MTMKCSVPECDSEIDMFRYHVRIGNKLFCSGMCAERHIMQNIRFGGVADQFDVPSKKRLNGDHFGRPNYWLTRKTKTSPSVSMPPVGPV